MPKRPKISLERVSPQVGLWQRAVAAFGFGHSCSFVCLVIWIVVCATWLATGDSPWAPKIVERLDAGKNPTDAQLMAMAIWGGAAVNLLGSIALVVTFPWWGKKNGARLSAYVDKRPFPWRFALMLVGIGAFACFLWIPRLEHSLTNDEELAFRNYVSGKWTEEAGQREYKEHGWDRTIFQSRANNHNLQAIASRAVNDLWRARDGERKPSQFSEKALRIPSLLAGVGAILLVGTLGYMVRGARVGIAAASLLALSPWFLRYAGEARGYAMLIFGILAALVLAIVAIEHGKVRWWALLGLAQAAFMACFLGAIYVSVALNLVILVTMLVREGWKRASVSRFVGSAICCVMAYGGFLTVATVQTWEMINGPRFDGALSASMGFPWIRELVSHLVAGVPWNAGPAAFHNGTSIQQGWDGQPFYEWVVVLIFPGLAVFGLVQMTASDWKARMAVLPVTLAVLFAVVHNKFAGNLMFVWYVVYAIIPFVLSVASGADKVAPRATRNWAWFLIPVLALYVMIVLEPIQLLRSYDRQPMRQVIEKARGTGYAATRETDDGIITATFSTSARQILSYDPWVRLPKSKDELEKIIEEAKANQKQLVVYFCGQERAASEFTELYERVTASSDFERIQELKGAEPLFRYSLYQLK